MRLTGLIAPRLILMRPLRLTALTILTPLLLLITLRTIRPPIHLPRRLILTPRLLPSIHLLLRGRLTRPLHRHTPLHHLPPFHHPFLPPHHSRLLPTPQTHHHPCILVQS